MGWMKALIVEDNAIVALALERFLKNIDVEVTAIVSHGEHVAQSVEDNCPDVVLMDVVLKGRMSGIEAAIQLMNRWDVPIIYITAHHDVATMQKVRETDPFAYIIKPINYSELRELLDRVSNNRPDESDV
jgi:two-component SAPR family response regulator